ncbi:hypothetical protein [Sinorhizobium sp. M4_45]|uniref:hypothetical protein n=1 Tax=Sinorhizobium sp. M4_45 TaxID=2037901 RepID=UPI000C9B91A4|nr:hypothetical protein [Sinorhizobium sp. M4_45]PND27629.1 hypothetical protein CN933_05745 [Sinorhizobium sp. M4_45]
MPLRNPPTPERLVDAIKDLLAGGDIGEMLKGSLGKALYDKYVPNGRATDTQIHAVLQGVERDGFERRFFTYLLARSLKRYLVQEILDAYPETLADFPDIASDVERVLPPLRSAASKFRLRAAALHTGLKDELNQLTVHVFIHGCLARLRYQVLNILHDHASSRSLEGAALLEIRIGKLLEEIDDELQLLPARTLDFAEERAWVDELKLLAAALKESSLRRDPTFIDTAGKIGRLINNNFARVNASLVDRMLEIHVEQVADLLGGPQIEPGVLITNLPLTPLARALTGQFWQLTEAKLWLLLMELDDDYASIADVYRSWLQLNQKLSWLATKSTDSEWRDQLISRTDKIGDLVAGDGNPLAQMRATLVEVDRLILSKLDKVANHLQNDCKSLMRVATTISLAIDESDEEQAA